MNIFPPEPTAVYYHPKWDRLILINPPTLFMLATLEGSNGRKLCINIDEEIKRHNLTFIGDL